MKELTSLTPKINFAQQTVLRHRVWGELGDFPRDSAGYEIWGKVFDKVASEVRARVCHAIFPQRNPGRWI